MEMRIISSKGEIQELDPSEKYVHIAFRPSMNDVITLMKKCKDLKLIEIAQSYVETLSKSFTDLLTFRGVTLITGDIWGHRKDINEYVTIDTKKILDLADTMSTRKIAEECGLSVEMVDFVITQ